jgi:hypothetical protein
VNKGKKLSDGSEMIFISGPDLNLTLLSDPDPNGDSESDLEQDPAYFQKVR